MRRYDNKRLMINVSYVTDLLVSPCARSTTSIVVALMTLVVTVPESVAAVAVTVSMAASFTGGTRRGGGDIEQAKWLVDKSEVGRSAVCPSFVR